MKVEWEGSNTECSAGGTIEIETGTDDMQNSLDGDCTQRSNLLVNHPSPVLRACRVIRVRLVLCMGPAVVEAERRASSSMTMKECGPTMIRSSVDEKRESQ